MSVPLDDMHYSQLDITSFDFSFDTYELASKGYDVEIVRNFIIYKKYIYFFIIKSEQSG